MIKRYTQGFGYFGPMEQSDDGKWVKYEDYEDRVDSLTRQCNELYNSYRDSEAAVWDLIQNSSKSIFCWQIFAILEGIILAILAINLYTK